ncbi:hypothetical protein CDL12_02453 [Handroanthus impetiginosus]|uniref:Phloem protein n=1 Tax=Handroanthus impetiginosus TaxID=429701 RepID=A0A2G9I4X2_9LAMI|nr:hypothetical protein CDL12_02453 [Handroanthus impetiginosus]
MAANRSPHHVGNTSLEFLQNEKPMTIKPQDLNIVWGEDSRYWNVPKSDDDKGRPAVLNQVYWLEVTGCVNGIRSDKQYEVVFRLSLTPDAFGFGGSPLYVMVKRGKKGKFKWSKFSVNPDERGEFKISGKLMKPDQDQG